MTLLAPVGPGTVFGTAHHTGPADRALPPGAFLEAAAGVVGPGDPVPLPDGIGRVDAEAELAVVAGAPLRHARQARLPWHACYIGPDSATATRYGVSRLPSVWLIGPDGRVEYKHVGPVNERILVDRIEAILAASGSREETP